MLVSTQLNETMAINLVTPNNYFYVVLLSFVIVLFGKFSSYWWWYSVAILAVVTFSGDQISGLGVGPDDFVFVFVAADISINFGV